MTTLEPDELKRYECRGPTMYIDAESVEAAQERYEAMLNNEEIDCVEMD